MPMAPVSIKRLRHRVTPGERNVDIDETFVKIDAIEPDEWENYWGEI